MWVGTNIESITVVIILLYGIDYVIGIVVHVYGRKVISYCYDNDRSIIITKSF